LVKLRLRRVGRKKLPIYKIVAADSRSPRDGRFIESLGTYNPNSNPAHVEVNETRVYHWLKAGAKPTYTVKNLLSRKGILLRLSLMKKGLDESKVQEEFGKWMSYQTVKLQKETEKKLRKKDKKKKKAAAEHVVKKEAEPEKPAENAQQTEPQASGEDTIKTEAGQ
jgi:small subunit ribosomal protein S16